MNKHLLKLNAFTIAECGRSPLLNGGEGTQGAPRIVRGGFTLAEVLITLGIIGVVAAMTMPTLIQNYKKHIVETRLAKFYTTINQAIQMSETVNGDKKDWDTLGKTFELGEDGNPDYSKPEAMAWFEKYLKPYINYSKVVGFNNKNIVGQVHLYFTDGSVVVFSGAAWSFYPDSKKLQPKIDENGLNTISKTNSGVDYFSFFFAPNNSTASAKYHYNKGVEPYMFQWDGTMDGEYGLKTSSLVGCKEDLPPNGRAYCTALIMQNGWKIPKDYPLKF